MNEHLPDEVVSPDKLDSLLMMIDEMGIRLIDDTDVAEFTKPGRAATKPEKTSPEPGERAPTAAKAVKSLKARPRVRRKRRSSSTRMTTMSRWI